MKPTTKKHIYTEEQVVLLLKEIIRTGCSLTTKQKRSFDGNKYTINELKEIAIKAIHQREVKLQVCEATIKSIERATSTKTQLDFWTVRPRGKLIKKRYT